MRKNVLIINCSPVRTGATAEIVRTAGEALKDAGEVKEICIDDYRIGFCKGCRVCHTTAECVQKDDHAALMDEFARADVILCVSPSYWADIPGEFKVFIDRCTPWSNTHEPHAKLPAGKKGYVISLRTGPGIAEAEKVAGSIEHFYGHLEIKTGGKLCLTKVENKEDAIARKTEITAFCRGIAEGL